MSINFIHYFSSTINKNVVYFTDLYTKEDINIFNNETLNKNIIKKFKKYPLINKKTKINKIINNINKIIYFKKNILSVNPVGIIILGGDIFSEYYPIKGLIYYFYLLFLISKKHNVFLVSQTIGPFRSWRKILAFLCLRDCIIFSRDTISAKYLKKSLKLKKVFESSDLAFLDLPRQNDFNKIKYLLENNRIIPNNYITIIPSGLVNNYTNNYKYYLKAWSNIINSLAKHPALTSKKIVLLAHVLVEDVDDRKIINHIRKTLQKKFSDRIIYVTDVLAPSEARIILGNGLFTITGRMHGAISTFQMLKPAISLSYSVKYKGVIGENLGMNDLIIEANDNALWSSGEIIELIMEKVNYILKNYDEIISRIKPAVDKNKNIAMAQIKYIAKNLEELM